MNCTNMVLMYEGIWLRVLIISVRLRHLHTGSKDARSLEAGEVHPSDCVRPSKFDSRASVKR